ncbi:hypothetical protein AAC387_Pa05g3517 [Persea americana]
MPTEMKTTGDSKDIPVGRALSGIDEIISKAFSNCLDVSKSTLPSTSCEKVYCLVDPPQWGDINCLTPG